MRDWRHGCFDYMGGIADQVGANLTTPFPLASDSAAADPAPAPAPSTIFRWDDPAMTQKRKKLLAVIGNLFPMAYWPDGQPLVQDASAAHGGGRYARMTCWQPSDGGTSCTGTNSQVGTLLAKTAYKWAFNAYNWKECWVPWGSDPARPLPSVGDIYLLYRDKVAANPAVKPTDSPHLRHCGFILQVPKSTSEPWVTADGGQSLNGRQVAYLNRRPWELRRPGLNIEHPKVWESTVKAHGFPVPIPEIDYPYLGGGAEGSDVDLSDANRLIGWIDMSSAAVAFLKEDFDPPQAKLRTFNKFTEDDYLDLGRRIDLVLNS